MPCGCRQRREFRWCLSFYTSLSFNELLWVMSYPFADSSYSKRYRSAKGHSSKRIRVLNFVTEKSCDDLSSQLLI